MNKRRKHKIRYQVGETEVRSSMYRGHVQYIVQARFTLTIKYGRKLITAEHQLGRKDE